MFDGRYREASSLLNASLADDIAAHDIRAANKMIMLAQIETARHNPAQASIWADRAVDASDSPVVLEPAAEVYLDSGAIPKALRQAERLAAQPSPQARADAEIVKGLAKQRAGDTRGAIELLENSEQLASTWLGGFWLGRAYLDSGEFLKADAQFMGCQQARVSSADLFHREQPTLRYFPPVIYYLARTRQALKRPAVADKFYERFLTLKSKGEPDALVEDAERRRKELSKTQ
jgi:tetratricopeptide (TPR) repeat protein